MNDPNKYKLQTRTKADGIEIIFEPVIESLISGVHFIIKDKHIIVEAGPSGTLAISFTAVEKFCKELIETKSVYEGVRM